jgi:hypothetical protein
MKYGLAVFKEGIVTNNYFHGEKCSQMFIQMNGCSILFHCNLWFKVTGIKMEQGLL